MISIRRVSLGGGYRYLIDSVAAGDGNPEPSKGLAHYYASTGTPPGVFLGSGLADLDGGKGIEKGSEVSEEHLYNMLAKLSDPVTGEALGGRLSVPGNATAVAGFDLTFSPPKSVSTTWALADEDTKAAIADCHLEAIDYVISYAEAHVFHSRSGAGGIVEEDVTGVIAASFTHFTSRADDPQLHDHVVIWNRARSVSDGKWRTLDSKAIFKATTTLSELHQGVLSDLLTARLGLGWEARGRRHSSKPRYEITGVSESLMAEFSRRSQQIAEQTELLRSEFKAAHGRSATAVEDMRLHAVATIATRPEKTKHSLAELTETWRERAASHVEKEEQLAWVASLRDRNDLPLLRCDDLGEAILADAAQAVVTTVAEHHSTYGRQHLVAEAHRMLHGVRFASPDERVAVAEHIVELAIERSVCLTPPPLQHTPERYVRADGSSRLHSESRIVYTTEALLGAEARLLEAARSLGAPRVGVAVVAQVTEANLPGRNYKLSTDQALAVEKIATSGRVLDVLVGPAGTGKSTAMAGLRAVWEQVHGPGSVIGLAPSAAAAQVLSDELGIETENTAKWLTEYRRLPELNARRERLALNLARHAYPRSPSAARLRARLAETERAISERRLKPAQLVMIDESSLAGTFGLDELVSAARTAGAKILLLGDHAQMSSVEAGGAFSLLVKDRGELVPELSDVRRFSSEWEKAASIELRAGNPSAIGAYEAHGRVASGDRESMLEAVYAAWKADVTAGRSSLMIAGDSATVAELNRRARTARVAEGAVAESGIVIAEGQRAGVGDEIVTRQNNRLLTTGKSSVKNGDRFVVAATNSDGSMAVRRVFGGAQVVLPADYVTEHVELAYATTSYRSQSRTVDTTHSLVSPTTTREVLYVAATRGRESNMIYVDTSFDPDPATGHDGTITRQNAREVLAGVLANEGRDLSAHEVLERAQRHSEDFSVLAAEYETMAHAAQQQRWDDLLDRSGLEPRRLEQVRQSPAYGPLIAALREAEAHGLEVEQTLPRLVAARPLGDAEDPAAVLRDRVGRWTEVVGSSRRAHTSLIAGLIPRVAGVTDPDLARGLEERDEAMQRRARALAEQAIARNQTWVRRLGIQPTHLRARERWLEAFTTVVAYRDRWNIDDDQLPLGPKSPARTIEATNERELARVALERASRLSSASEARQPEPVDVGLIRTGEPSL